MRMIYILHKGGIGSSLQRFHIWSNSMSDMSSTLITSVLHQHVIVHACVCVCGGGGVGGGSICFSGSICVSLDYFTL